MCATRWVERHDSVIVLIELLPAVVPALNEIMLWRDKDASIQASLLSASILKSDFLVSMFCLSKLFAVTKTLCEYLQSVNMDLQKAMMYANLVLEILEQMNSNSETTFREIFEAASSTMNWMKDTEGDDIRMPRCSAGKKSQFRNNVPAETPEEYYRRAIFLPFLNTMVTQIKQRFQKQNNILSKFSSITSPGAACDEETCNNFLKLTEFYSAGESIFLENKDVLLSELKMYKHAMKDNKGLSALQAFTMCDGEFFPRIKRLLKILCTIPITTCTSERTFSTLRRLKTYLRNTMSNECLNGLALLNTSHVKVSPIEVVDELAKKPRRLDFAL